MDILYESHKTRIEALPESGSPVQLVRKVVKGKFAKLICSREVRALIELRGLKGVQQIREQDSETSFISEFIPGISVKESSSIDICRTLNNVEGILDDIHNTGVCDLDFGNKRDWLIGSNGRPVLIDFAASIVPGDFFYDKLFQLGCFINLGSLLEFRYGLLAHKGFTEEEKEKLRKYQNMKNLFNRIRLK